jgi:hypothetical protein
VGEAGLGALEADFGHEVFEDGAVFAAADGFAVGADHFDVVFGEDAGVVESDGGVEAGLSAEGGQEGVGSFFFDDLGDGFDGDGLDVVRSAISGSVMMVAGLELTRMTL